jgi:two-component system KDP operon response regulator KdpE
MTAELGERTQRAESALALSAVVWYTIDASYPGVQIVMPTRVLVVDDAPEMTRFLEQVLKKENYEVAVAHSAREGLRQAHVFRPDLVLLDIMMPEMSGWDMLERLREFSNVPVIMLTAIDGTDNKVHGLDSGADDYVTKPFELQELKARIRSTLRRAASIPPEENQVFSFDGGQLVIDPQLRQVTCQGEAISLTPTEYKLLLFLACNAGQVLSYEQILSNVWGPGYEDSPSAVKVYVRRLRQKIEADPQKPRYLLTQWGIGYCLARL